MALFLSYILLLPLLQVHAQYPGIQVSDGVIHPTGTFSACSTITTTISKNVHTIPVPCTTTPSVITEEVMVALTAKLVIGPSGLVSFLCEDWLGSPTFSSATSGSTSGSGTGSQTGWISSSSIGSGHGLSTGSSSDARTGSNTGSTSVPSATFTGSSRGGSSSRSSSQTGLSAWASGHTLSTGSSNASRTDTISFTGTSSIRSSESTTSLSGTGVRPESTSRSSGTGSQSSGSSSNIGSQSSRSSSSSPSSSTASPGSASTSATSPSSTAVADVSSVPNAVSPVASATTTLVPTGVVASSSAKELQTSIAAIIPIIQSYIDDPSPPKSDDAIKAVKGVLPFAENLSKGIGPPPSPKSCRVSTNIITDIFNAVSCVAENLNKAVQDIEGGINNMNNLKDGLQNLNNLQKPLDNRTEEDNENDDDNESKSDNSKSQQSSDQSSEISKSGSQTSTGFTSSVTSVSSSPSTSSGLSSSSSASSSESCVLPPEVTLPPDSTDSVQPDQPTSVVVSGLSLSSLNSASTTSSISGSGPSTPSTLSTNISTDSASPIISSASVVTSPPICLNDPVQQDPPNCAQPSSSQALFCSAGSNLGAATFDPATWCGCNTNSGTLYQTMSTGSGDAACAYKTLPTSTVKPTEVKSSSQTGTGGSPTGSLSCASSSDSIPTGVPQADAQSNINGWCTGELSLFKPGIKCDNENQEGYFLSDKCFPKLVDYSLQYYHPGATMYLKVSLAPGTDTFVANSSTCDSALGRVLNECPPFSGEPLMKFGGNISTDDGTGNMAIWHIDLKPPTAII